MTSSDKVKQIKANLQSTGSEELQRIWQENDHEQYTEAAFLAIKEILQERGITPPTPGKPRMPPPEGQRVAFEWLSHAPFRSEQEISNSNKWPTIITSTIWFCATGVAIFFLHWFLISEVVSIIVLGISMYLGGRLPITKRNLLEWYRWISARNGALLGYVLAYCILLLLPAVDVLGVILSQSSFLRYSIFITLLEAPSVLGLYNAIKSEKKNIEKVTNAFRSWQEAGWDRRTNKEKWKA